MFEHSLISDSKGGGLIEGIDARGLEYFLIKDSFFNGLLHKE